MPGPGGPSRLLVTNPNINVTTPVALSLSPVIVDYVALVNNDSAANSLRLYLSTDGGNTWQQFFRANAVAAGASTFAQLGGIVIPALAAAPNGVTTTGMAAFLFGWPVTQ